MSVTVGGGIGFLERLYGLTLDSMLSTRILLADKNVVTANHEQYQDLFWALRGGAGGSLGINTEFTFKIYKLTQVVLFQFWFSKDKLKQVLKFWQSWGPFTDHRLTSELNLFAKRELPVNVTGQFTGPKGELIKLTAFFSDLADQSKVWTATTKEAAIHYATPFPMPFQFFRNLFAVQKLNDKMVQILDQFIEDAPTGITIKDRMSFILL